jgi:hypothetical protein
MHFSDNEIILMSEILIKLLLEDTKRKVKSDIDQYIDTLDTKPSDIHVSSSTNIEINETNSGSDEELPVSTRKIRGRGRPRKNF